MSVTNLHYKRVTISFYLVMTFICNPNFVGHYRHSYIYPDSTVYYKNGNQNLYKFNLKFRIVIEPFLAKTLKVRSYFPIKSSKNSKKVN